MIFDVNCSKPCDKGVSGPQLIKISPPLTGTATKKTTKHPPFADDRWNYPVLAGSIPIVVGWIKHPHIYIYTYLRGCLGLFIWSLCEDPRAIHKIPRAVPKSLRTIPKQFTTIPKHFRTIPQKIHLFTKDSKLLLKGPKLFIKDTNIFAKDRTIHKRHRTFHKKYRTIHTNNRPPS